MARPYVCTECHETRSTSATRGRLPKVCPECRGVTGYVLTGDRPDPPPDPPADKQPRLSAGTTGMEHLPRPGGLMALPEARPVHPKVAKALEIVARDAQAPPPARTPFNSAPERAPVPAAPKGAGQVERKLHADLAMLQAQGSPVADTLAAMALMLARSADSTSAAGGSVRELIAATKELRAILDQIAKSAPEGGGNRGDENPSEGPFGPVRPEVVNT